MDMSWQKFHAVAARDFWGDPSHFETNARTVCNLLLDTDPFGGASKMASGKAHAAAILRAGCASLGSSAPTRQIASAT